MGRSWLLAPVIAALAIAGCGSSGKASKAAAVGPPSSAAPAAPSGPFLADTTKVSTVASTVPADGDVNPYGLTTALAALPGGYIVVGSLPTTNGMSATAKYGCLIVLNSAGKPVSTIAGSLVQGPWDMTAVTQGSTTTLFVSMALNGGAAKGRHVIKNSTVVRIRVQSGTGEAPKVLGEQVIAGGIPWRDDPNALVIGPTGVGLATNGTLYLADTLDNRIAAIPDAPTRTTAAPFGGTTVS